MTTVLLRCYPFCLNGLGTRPDKPQCCLHAGQQGSTAEGTDADELDMQHDELALRNYAT